MRKLFAPLAGLCLLAGLASCNTPEEKAAGKAALQAAGALAGEVAAVECQSITKNDAPLYSACVDATGALISIGAAKAQGLISKK